MASMTKALCNNCLYPLEIARISDPTSLPVKARQKELHTKTMILVLRLDFIFVWPTMSIMTSSSLHPKSLSPPLPVFEFNPDGRMLPKVKCLPLASPAAPSVHPARPLPAPLTSLGGKITAWLGGVFLLLAPVGESIGGRGWGRWEEGNNNWACVTTGETFILGRGGGNSVDMRSVVVWRWKGLNFSFQKQTFHFKRTVVHWFFQCGTLWHHISWLYP